MENALNLDTVKLAENKKEIVMLKEKVDEIDPEAFVIVTDAREVHGEGFIEKK
mgnify:CR=1 FL=1